MGQTSTTCKVRSQAFTATQHTRRIYETLRRPILQPCQFSLASAKQQNKNESWTTGRNICAVQLVPLSTRSPCSSAPWKGRCSLWPQATGDVWARPYGGRWRDSACFHRPTKSPFINQGPGLGRSLPPCPINGPHNRSLHRGNPA